MKRRWSALRGSWAALCALACVEAAMTMGCGAAPESVALQDREASDEHATIKAKYPATWSVVQSFLRRDRELRGRSVGKVTELYRPDVEGPAYLEFALREGPADAGYVIASTGEHDFPIMAWSDRG